MDDGTNTKLAKLSP